MSQRKRIVKTWIEITGLEPPPAVMDEVREVLDVEPKRRTWSLFPGPDRGKGTVYVDSQDLMCRLRRSPLSEDGPVPHRIFIRKFSSVFWACEYLSFAHAFLGDLGVSSRESAPGKEAHETIRRLLTDLYRDGVEKITWHLQELASLLCQARDLPLIERALQQQTNLAKGRKPPADHTAIVEYMGELKRDRPWMKYKDRVTATSNHFKVSDSLIRHKPKK